MNEEFSQFGKLLIVTGLIVTVIGVLIILLSKSDLGKLPGDMDFSSKNWRIFLPITSCIILSIILTFIMWIIQVLKK